MKKITINDVKIDWDLKKGTLHFFGISSTLFWNDPSLLNIFKPLVQEIGKDMFRLQVAYSSSLGTKRDYETMVSELGNNFEEGLSNWGKAVSGAGWGILKVEYIDYQNFTAIVSITNPWELEMQRNLEPSLRWGCPFFQGKIIGLFNNDFKKICWANESYTFTENESKVVFEISLYNFTIEDEINLLRKKRENKKILQLNQIIEDRIKERDELVKQQDLQIKINEELESIIEDTHEELKFKNSNLKELNTNLASVLDATIEMILFYDREHIIVEVNNATLKTLKLENKTDIIGHNLDEFVISTDVKKIMNARQNDKVETYELTFMSKNNEAIYTLNTSKRIVVDGNKLTMATMINLTKIKEQEQKLLAQARLAQMGEMISMIAHQWRQPLGSIASAALSLKLKFNLEVFDMDTKEGQIQQKEYFIKHLSNIEKYTKNMSSTIEDFRNFYQTDKEFVHIDFSSIVRKALGIIHTTLINENIEIIYEYSSNKKLKMHVNEVMQVLLNIFQNALDNFRSKNKENPTLRILTHDDSIYIFDNGGGINPDIIPKIFDPYFSTKEDKNGTGLGLYMSKIIIEEHHQGKILVTNRDDGVCFKISLP